jgi:hypothetical protein
MESAAEGGKNTCLLGIRREPTVGIIFASGQPSEDFVNVWFASHLGDAPPLGTDSRDEPMEAILTEPPPIGSPEEAISLAFLSGSRKPVSRSRRWISSRSRSRSPGWSACAPTSATLRFSSRYLDEDCSGLKAKVTADGPNDFDFKLTKDDPSTDRSRGPGAGRVKGGG